MLKFIKLNYLNNILGIFSHYKNVENTVSLGSHDLFIARVINKYMNEDNRSHLLLKLGF